MRLAVELYGVIVGHIDAQGPQDFDFRASTEAISRFGINSDVLSVAVPLTDRPPRHHAAKRRNFFNELLPEGDILTWMLERSGLRRGDTPAFLARYGRDIAGAVQIWDADDPSEPPTPEATLVSDREIRSLLESPQADPLANRRRSGRTSLAGVQPKIVLAQRDGRWHRVAGGYPSTHIIKPSLSAHPTVIGDEEYGWRLARAIGLADYRVELTAFAELPALVIERFDRNTRGERLHQEDFNQALGAAGDEKYQEVGGAVTLRRIAETVRRRCPKSELIQLARQVVLCCAIGNLDMHAKNLGLMHLPDQKTLLAPAYDMVPMAQHRDADGRLALTVDRHYRLADLSHSSLVSELSSWKLSDAERIVTEALEEIRAAVSAETPDPSASPDLQESIGHRTQRLREH